ncbi:NADH:ubiquinone oxidoreductase subunit J [Lacunisphaera limnophila]|uniref:NADH-quinone oxidoreductase subunit J n=1 Tax=Lacunisphaera limnophila TaxID=1838286 RepID=A0A1D8AV68_9BACT|nr:NADH-quinone oxidoreductase subunit J [Lacunisphaera limnophila]AOS44798.1 NADH:ubiquinone oxidoreductase subunit J [Lacunisphaera limnophila]
MMLALLIIALVILGAAAAAMLSRNLIHSALLLVGAWAGIAAFYLWAGAEFVAFAQILVYVGAVSMVVLFAVLLTRQGETSAPVGYDSLKRAVLAFIVAGGVGGLLVGAILGSPLDVHLPAATPTLSVQQIGALLMGPYAPALLIVGVLLTVALLGAVVLAAVDQPEDTP